MVIEKRQSAAELRQLAEARLSRSRAQAAVQLSDMEAQRLVHELQVHEIELEMQNMELRQAKIDLEELAAQYTDIYDFAPLGYFSIDPSGQILKLNLAASKFFGVDRSRLIQRRFASFLDPADRTTFGQFLASVFAHGNEAVLEVSLAPNGPPRRLLEITALRSSDGRECRLIMTDITVRRQAEDLLRDLSGRLAHTEESERRKLNGELHDRVGQNLIALSLNFGLLRARLSDEARSGVADILVTTQDLLKTTATEVRNVMADLHPPALEDYGLWVALRTYVESLVARTGMQIKLKGGEIHPRPSRAIELALFRIAQAALGNLLKHAGKASVAVTLEQPSRMLRLTISDTGCGFDLTQTESARSGGGLGIMRERAQAVGAHLDIVSTPGLGTSVSVTLAHG